MAERRTPKRLKIGAQSQSGEADRFAFKTADSTSIMRIKTGEVKKKDRYKKIRFFERQKVVRKLKQAAKKLQQMPGVDDVEQEMESLRKELNYIMHFPFDQKYISLYSQMKTTDEKALLAKNQMIDEIWTQVQSGEVEDLSQVELERVTTSKQGSVSRLGRQNTNSSFEKIEKDSTLSSSVSEEMPSPHLSKQQKTKERRIQHQSQDGGKKESKPIQNKATSDVSSVRRNDFFL